jgi:hypothetical protein
MARACVLGRIINPPLGPLSKNGDRMLDLTFRLAKLDEAGIEVDQVALAAGAQPAMIVPNEYSA